MTSMLRTRHLVFHVMSPVLELSLACSSMSRTSEMSNFSLIYMVWIIISFSLEFSQFWFLFASCCRLPVRTINANYEIYEYWLLPLIFSFETDTGCLCCGLKLLYYYNFSHRYPCKKIGCMILQIGSVSLLVLSGRGKPTTRRWFFSCWLCQKM